MTQAEFMQMHEGIVRTLARKLLGACGPALGLDDLLQVGRMGVLRARQTYDPTKGAVSTYVWFWVRSYMLTEIQNHGRVIRVPAGVHRSGNLPPPAVYGADLTRVAQGPAEDQDELEERAQRIDEAIQQLPPTHARVIRRRYMGPPQRRARKAPGKIEKEALAMLAELLDDVWLPTPA